MLLRIGFGFVLIAGLMKQTLCFAEEATEPTEEASGQEVSETPVETEQDPPKKTESESSSQDQASPDTENTTGDPSSEEAEPESEAEKDSKPEKDAATEKDAVNEENKETTKEGDKKQSLKKTQKKLNKPKWNLSGGGQYIYFFSDLVDPSFGLGLNLSYQQTKKTRIQVSQSITKLLVKNKDDEEFVLQDTLISYTYQPRLTFFNGGRANVGTSLKLPLSDYSRINGVWASVGLRTSLTWSYLNDTLSNTIGASGLVYINQFRTKHEDFGGSALPYLSGNASWSLAYTGKKNFTYSFAASYGEIRYYNITDESFLVDTAFDHPYSVGLSMSYQIMAGLNAGLSYGQSNIFEQYGNLDYYVFDENNSNLVLSINYSKSF